MTILDRHLAWSFFASYVILLLTGIGLYVFTDILVNFDEFTENRALSTADVVALMLDFYGPNLAMYFSQISGPVMAVAAAFTIALMQRNNELTAVVAAGVPLQRLLFPILVVAVFIIAAWVGVTEFIVPEFAAKISRRHQDLHNDSAVGVYAARDGNNSILSARELYAAEGRLRGVFIIAPDAEGRPSQLIRADAATWSPPRRAWQLERGSRLDVGEAFGAGDLTHALRWTPLNEYPFTLAPEELRLRQTTQWTDLMSIRQINALAGAGSLPNLPTILRTRDVRFTQPLLQLILLLLVTPFFLTRQPTNVLEAGGRAIAFAGACFLVAFLAQNVPTDVEWTRFAAGIPLIIFGPLAVYLVSNAKT